MQRPEMRAATMVPGENGAILYISGFIFPETSEIFYYMVNICTYGKIFILCVCVYKSVFHFSLIGL